VEKKRVGRELPREREEKTLQTNLERERKRNNEISWPKTYKYPFSMKLPFYPYLKRVKYDSET
jgi:hypothetical protein